MNLRRPTQKQRRFVMLVLAVLVFAIAYHGGNKYSGKEMPTISGILLRPLAPMAKLDLRDLQDQAFASIQLLEHWSLLVLDPRDLSDSQAYRRLVQVHNRLILEPETQKMLQFLYLPLHTPRTQSEMLYQQSSGFFTLTGEPDKVNEIFDQLGVDPNLDNFSLYLVDPAGMLQALFTSEQDAATIAQDITSIISQY